MKECISFLSIISENDGLCVRACVCECVQISVYALTHTSYAYWKVCHWQRGKQILKMCYYFSFFVFNHKTSKQTSSKIYKNIESAKTCDTYTLTMRMVNLQVCIDMIFIMIKSADEIESRPLGRRMRKNISTFRHSLRSYHFAIASCYKRCHYQLPMILKYQDQMK